MYFSCTYVCLLHYSTLLMASALLYARIEGVHRVCRGCVIAGHRCKLMQHHVEEAVQAVCAGEAECMSGIAGNDRTSHVFDIYWLNLASQPAHRYGQNTACVVTAFSIVRRWSRQKDHVGQN